jgi:outer membrane lipoprotein-sorting protein
MARLLRSRSLVAALVAAAAIVLAAALVAAGSTSEPDLAPLPADRLIASSLAAVADPSLSVSGTVATHVDLGIPQLPGVTTATTGPLSLLLSNQTIKTWRSSDGIRIAQILPAAERDVVLTPSDLWVWDSDRFAAWHKSLPDRREPTSPSLVDVEGIVSHVISLVEPYARLTTSSPVNVAGRSAYVVRLTPASPSDTLVDRIDVAIDAQTRVPLRLEVFAEGAAAPVVRIAYTAVAFDPVDASVFHFTPPEGADVHEVDEGWGGGEEPSSNLSRLFAEISDVRTFGRGFGLIVAVRVSDVPPEVTPFFPYRGPIASADVLDRGDHAWIVSGLVRPEALAKVEPELA